MRRIPLLALTVALIAAFGASGAHAAASASAPKYNIAVGIGDQNAPMFTNKYFTPLGIKKVRYFIPWDAAKDPAKLALADAYVAAAKQAHATVLMHVGTNDFDHKAAKIPTTAQYKLWVGKLVKRYKAKGVKDWGVFNEANNQSEPTWNHPAAAANFFKVMRSLCSGCTIVSLDVLDQPGVSSYIKKFFTALGKSYAQKATLVGIHNYSDTNRYRSSGTKTIIDSVRTYDKKATFWLTETGGVASFGSNFPCSTTRQKKAESYMFTLAKKFKSYVKRLYTYSFFGTPDASCQAGDFDAGLLTSDGTKTRPAYTVFKTQLKSFSR